MNVLELKKMGWSFTEKDVGTSDINNYCVCTTGYNVRGKDGKMYFLEFTRSSGIQYRYKNKRNGQRLKKPVREIVEKTLVLDSAFETENGTFRSLILERTINEMRLPYTTDGILEAVNAISSDVYDAVKFVNER